MATVYSHDMFAHRSGIPQEVSYPQYYQPSPTKSSGVFGCRSADNFAKLNKIEEGTLKESIFKN